MDVDKERMTRLDEEEKEEIDDTELERLLAGGLPFCRKAKECGHKCLGVKGEEQCLPCLDAACVQSSGVEMLPTQDELCGICYTCELNEEPSVQLGCGHVFHANCVLELLKHKWTTLRITFAFMNCPSCKQPIEAEHVAEIDIEIEKLMVLRSDIQVKAMKIVKKEKLDRDPRLKTPGDHFFGNVMAFAEAKVSFY